MLLFGYKNDNSSRILIMNATRLETARQSGIKPEWLELVKQQVNSLHFGVVQIVIHDAQVTRLEKTERLRLAPKNLS